MGDKASFIKNPIGIIGIFLVLTEAIASLVIVNSNLNDLQNTILVLFIVIFPCLVLAAFYLLVTKYHENLYSPSDYRDEQNFVKTYDKATQRAELVPFQRDDREEPLIDADMAVMKDALANIVEMQKKIVTSIEDLGLSENEKDQYVSKMEDYLFEIENPEMENIVEISPMYKSAELLRKISRQGYLTNIYRSPSSDKMVVPNAEHQAIWLGSEIPIEMAVDVIKVAKEFYPHLRYIELNDCEDGAPEFVKYQIFIGGATSTAKDRKLKPLNDNDFDKLCGMKDRKEMHAFVKTFTA